MTSIPWYEWVGYVASFLVAVSLSMRSILKLRWYNLAGALFFSFYGLLIKSYPVAFVNFYIAVMDVFYLVRIYRKREAFSFYLRPFDDAYVSDFFSFYKDDIQKIVPGISLAPQKGDFVLLLFRDLAVAGVVWGREKEKGALEIFLDYVTPDYRDFKVGQYIYGKGNSVFSDLGYTMLWTKGLTAIHKEYLFHMGFVQEGADFRLTLNGGDTSKSLQG